MHRLRCRAEMEFGLAAVLHPHLAKLRTIWLEVVFSIQLDSSSRGHSEGRHETQQGSSRLSATATAEARMGRPPTAIARCTCLGRIVCCSATASTLAWASIQSSLSIRTASDAAPVPAPLLSGPDALRRPPRTSRACTARAIPSAWHVMHAAGTTTAPGSPVPATASYGLLFLAFTF